MVPGLCTVWTLLQKQKMHTHTAVEFGCMLDSYKHWFLYGNYQPILTELLKMDVEQNQLIMGTSESDYKNRSKLSNGKMSTEINWRWLQATGLQGCIAHKICLISLKKCKCQLKCANHLTWASEKWNNVLFSD